MKTIIIPTDFSPAASNAMQYGIDMAKAVNGSLMLFHVYQVPVSYSEVPIMLVSVDELQAAAEKQLQELKQQVEHITSGSIKVYAEVRMGNLTDELEVLCRKVAPFAVVMGTSGASGVERVLFGSNTLAVMRHLTYPVIVVPPGKTYGNGIKKIGLACDLKNTVQTMPAIAIKEFVKQFHAELHVLNVDHDNKHFTPETPEQSALLHTLLEEVNPVYDFIEHKDIEDGINDFAEKNNLDLIIAIPKKHNLFESLFRHSSTKQLVAQSHVPVMCIHE